MRFGLFLNAGESPGRSHDEIYDLVLRQVELAERLGYHDAWITEHHFIPFGINSSALAAAAFLLGRTEALRIGTAVTLAPQYHPVQLAEQAAILDQMSDGRFDFGIGRGGYRRDFEVFGVPEARWHNEVQATAQVLLDVWAQPEATSDTPVATFEALTVRPRPRTQPHPPLFIASSSPESLQLAAANGLPLQHYFGVPAEARVKIEQQYRAHAEEIGVDVSGIDHLHAAVIFVTTDEPESDARERIRENLLHSFRAGDQPTVSTRNRHVGPDGKPLDREDMARGCAERAFIGSPESVVEQLSAFIATTGARRIALYHEIAVEPSDVLASITSFATDVLPALTERLPSVAVGERSS